jgi:hypothetical protein
MLQEWRGSKKHSNGTEQQSDRDSERHFVETYISVISQGPGYY